MKKIVIIVSLIIVVLLGLIYIKPNKTFMDNGVLIAVVVDGTTSSSFPNQGNYKVDVDCNNSTGYWDFSEWKLMIEDIKTNPKCNLTFTTINNDDYLNNHIINLAGKGEVFNEGENLTDAGYRYEGKDPNNFVWFNNELWRIIGVFGDNYHGKSGNLVKIIRDESLQTLSLNMANNSTFVGSYIYNILNGAYINANNTWIDTTNCYGNKNLDKITTCDYTYTGIKTSYLNMVEDAYWLINTVSTTSATKTSSFSTGTKTSTSFKIGLMTASEYAYGASSSCTSNISSFNTDSCAGLNWLYGRGFEWIITPYSSSTGFELSRNGNLVSENPKDTAEFRPSLYLKSNIYIVSGTGTRSNPYRIGLST